MQFTYHECSGDDILTIDAELHKYLFKIRRHGIEDDLFFRNIRDNNLYRYHVKSIDRRKTILSLVDFQEKIIEPKKKLHLAWCVIDPKSIEKYIASLNEIGVDQITFIYCKFSQQKYKPNFEKLNKLLFNSSSQCGRSSIIRLNSCNSLDQFLLEYPDSFMFNFSQNNINEYKDNIETIILGCEGGFSDDEVKKFSEDKIVGIDSSLILRSETASISLASMILL